MLEVLHAESQALHHGKEEFRVGSSEGEPAGVFLVNILGQHAPDRGRGILSMDAGEEDGKIPDVQGVLLLEMYLQLVLCEATCGKVIPGPVMFVVHDTQKGFEKSRFRHTSCHRALPSLLKRRYNLLPGGESQ